MPAFVVILVLAAIVFAFARRPISTIIKTEDFVRRRTLWFALTVTIFLASSFWIYTAIAIILLAYTTKRELNPSALFFFILFALPDAHIIIPGMGIVNYLFQLSHARILELFILLPAFFTLIRQSETLAFGRLWADKILAAYLLLATVVYLREVTVTDTLRHAFYYFIDAFLPYFVISRSLKNMQAFRDTLLSFVLATLILALVGVFEISRHWLLYRDLPGELGLIGINTQGAYLQRDGMVRALASTLQPIALGYVIAVGIGFYLFLQRLIQQKPIRMLGMALLVAGLLATLSRGPWVGAAVLFLVFILTGRSPIRKLATVALVAIFTFPIITIIPGGEKIVNLLPFVGTTEQATIEGREQLFTNSMLVIQRNPWLGSTNYIDTPEMQELIIFGGGFVDIVNSYLRIALELGLTGLGLFVSFFTIILMGIFQAMRSLPDKDGEEYALGQTLFATILSALVIIATVSSIGFVPIVYWSVAGMGIAYTQMMRSQK